MITICVPAYNEEKNLQKAIENIARAAKKAGNIALDIVIVNDGSMDRTKDVIHMLEKTYPYVRSIHHRHNRGIGIGVQEVIAIAKYPKFMIVPGDNDASPVLLTTLFRNRKKAEMVLSYYLNKELRGRFRNFISTLYGLIYMITFDVYIQYFNGVGIYSTEKVKKLSLRSTRFGITAELNTKLLRMGCTLYELPGLMQTGTEGSTSLQWKNMLEVARTFAQLFHEIHIRKRRMFSYRPRRIHHDR